MNQKESIRKKIEELKEQSEGFLSDERLPSDVKFFISSILSLMKVIVLVLLEKKTRKNSSNSGLPPSRNNGPNGNRNKKSEKDGDKKKGSKLNNTRVLETKKTLSPENCKDCGLDLGSTKTSGTDERKEIDIIYEVHEHSVVCEIKDCPNCGTKNKCVFPKDMKGKIQYGIGIKASIINFLMVQMISLERTQEHFKGLLDRFISQSVMLKYVSQLSDFLKVWEKEKIKELLSHPVIYCDETSLRVDKKNHWIHSYSAGDITLKFLHKKRGQEAMEDIGILPKYGGIIVHDCWGSYLLYENLRHGLCGAHLLRELKFVEDSTKDKWATNMKRLLKRVAKAIASRPQSGVLKEKEYERFKKKYREILDRGKMELPEFPKPTGKKGRPKHTDAQNLWLRFKKYEESVLLFSIVKEVDFTNNRAERDLRDSKLKQKVSGTFRKLHYAECFVRISSYVKSMRYKGHSSLQAIMSALQGDIAN